MNPTKYKNDEASAPANCHLPVSKNSELSDKEVYISCARLMEENDFGTDAYMDAWALLEKTKNKNGGMPPV